MEGGEKHLEIPLRPGPEGQTSSYEVTFCMVLTSWCASGREILQCVSRSSSICPILRVNRNLDFKDTASEVLEGSKEYVIGNWRKGIHVKSCRKILKLPPIVTRKLNSVVELGRFQATYEGSTWFLLAAEMKRREINGGKYC